MKTESFELTVLADVERLPDVISFIEEHLEEINMKILMKITVSVEEIFVNIASYAYPSETGKATVRLEISDDPPAVIITFIDRGVPFDPLAKPDPDITLSAEERGIGGLGIYMTKQSMDDLKYTYQDGQNILTMRKEL